jgi:hypothetical protein
LLQAQLRGKLTREEEDMEDLLTSNVFGAMKYVPIEEGLKRLLLSCEDAKGKPPITSNQILINSQYEFWPSINETDCIGCEPDVLVNLKSSTSEKFVVFIEAKYLSEKSSYPDSGTVPNDQLAREYDNLIKRAEREKATPILLYVTAHMSYPQEVIQESINEFSKKRLREMKAFWLSWRKLINLFSDSRQAILTDLVEVLRRQGLTFFEGITRPEMIDFSWSFKKGIALGENYNWSYPIEQISWRFQP